MTIVSQGKMVINYDHVVSIQYNYTDIICQMDNGNVKILGSYDTEQRAGEVDQEMSSMAFPQDMICLSSDQTEVADLTAFRKGFVTLFPNENDEVRVTRYNPSTYYMPER